jgi:hypothetical protein
LDAWWETAACVLENAKLYMAVFVSLMRRSASVECCLAALVDGFAEQQNRAPVARRLSAQPRNRECYCIQNGSALIS